MKRLPIALVRRLEACSDTLAEDVCEALKLSAKHVEARRAERQHRALQAGRSEWEWRNKTSDPTPERVVQRLGRLFHRHGVPVIATRGRREDDGDLLIDVVAAVLEIGRSAAYGHVRRYLQVVQQLDGMPIVRRTHPTPARKRSRGTPAATAMKSK